MVRRCPYCGNIPEQPLLFKLAVQRIFNYIWNHPECTMPELKEKFGGQQSNSVATALTKIRQGLVDTPYRLISHNLPRTGKGNNAVAYQIIDMSPHKQKQEPTHGTL
jgi:hypothetical protein